MKGESHHHTLREQTMTYGVGNGQLESPPTFIDLFCGCGGFTLGMLRAGFRCLAALDSNSAAITTIQANLVERPHPDFAPVKQAIECDLTQFGPDELAKRTGTAHVDVIVGGPPCQGFSLARQADGSNHGSRIKYDPRRHLYREFLRYVEFFQPRIFVMENVLGLRNAAGGDYFTAVQKEARELGRSACKPGYRVHGQIEDAWELGVPQKRLRQLIIGVRNDVAGYFVPELKPAPRAEPRTWLWAAIGDLPILQAGNGEDEREYDFARRLDHVRQQGNTTFHYLHDVLEIDRTKKLTNHTARPHSERDLRDFALLKEGENSRQAIRDRGVVFEFPYDKSSFQDRFTRQSRWYPCSTIVAHLSKDGLMFIHPTQNRSLTPREAARVQSFPDWFRFPASRTHAYRLIGNAVPPLVAEAVGLAVKRFIDSLACGGWHERANAGSHNPSIEQGGMTRRTAASDLECLARLDGRALRALPTAEFLRGWHALLFLFPGLHPDNALDHGDTIEMAPANQLALPGFEELLSRRYARSGWPVALELIGRDAWRRYETDQISDKDFYCGEAQRAGLASLSQDAAPANTEKHNARHLDIQGTATR